MTAAPETNPAADEQPYHVRTTLNPVARDAFFLLQSKIQGIKHRRVSLPSVSQALLEKALANPDFVQELLDDLTTAHPARGGE